MLIPRNKAVVLIGDDAVGHGLFRIGTEKKVLYRLVVVADLIFARPDPREGFMKERKDFVEVMFAIVGAHDFGGQLGSLQKQRVHS